ncbi:TonB-dependent receptor plug domain-containing protein [Novosphingobium terrae]|uniref:TonB-dependent receptor plug domain-containing protein n=1 Tax=Novosphingobium terrae TaxID=2726189 RepID=UPI001F148156|nr:TonB-dependent receptor [Novosphingobium terrae]
MTIRRYHTTHGLRCRAMLATGGALIALMLATPALAQNTDAPPVQAPDTPAPAAAPSSPADIIVTGSRITSSGFSAPTPTQVLSSAAIAKNAQPNVFTTIAQLPSLQGSTGATVGTNSTSSGTQGLSSFSLRGLGTIRTLTLIDGQRVVGANVTGVPDVSLFPQLLIERVDVVTGGASASYGSDAVGGVVNFITKTHFEGFKANVQGGLTTYGDDGNYTFQAAAGKSFLDGRLHVVVSGEYSHEDGIPAAGFGDSGPDGRNWYRSDTLINRGVTNDGSPQYLYRQHVQAYQYTKYGLISAGPLQGIAFDKNGNPFNFNYGSGGVPAKNAAGNVSGCYSGFCVGGDLSGNVGIGTSLQSEITRWDGYGRIGFDVDSNNEIYGTLNVSRVASNNTPNPGAAKTGLTMQCSNPFVPASVQTMCANAGITSFSYGLSNAVLPDFINVNPVRRQIRGVVGAKGKLDVLGTNWSYDGYYEHGENITDIHVSNMTLTNRYNAAIQAVRQPDGTITCASAVAVAAGCQPLNIFGGATPSAATLAYITPANGPYQHTRQTQDVVSLAINGQPFSLPAGPVSIAFGGEYRHEYYKVNGDPYGNGVTADDPNTSAYPADPLLNTAGNNWYAGNYHNGTGKYDVYEGFLEVNAPLFDSAKLGKANLNLAGRGTHYSTSGTVYTWKIGGTWQTPIDGIRLRAVTSRDVRAPNLSELYAAPITVTVPGVTNPANNQAVTIQQNTIGNTALKPEIARNTEAGIVLSRPHWAPGLNLSFDYYRIKMTGVISSLTAQQEINYCSAGVTQLCSAFNLNAATPYANVQSFNLASIFTDGFDIEASYRFNLDSVKVPGSLTLRALGTNVRNFITDTGLPGTIPTQGAGVNAGATPHWKVLATESWDTDKFSLTLTQRWFSAGVFNNEYIVCQTNCPVSTVNHPTVDYNRMPGALYIDIGGTYNITKKLTAYVKVDNLFNHDPAGSPQTNTGVDVNPQLYDVIGRMYRFGVRYNF